MTGLREFGLHIIGAIGATAILIGSISVTLRVLPVSVPEYTKALRLGNERWTTVAPGPAVHERSVRIVSGPGRTEIRRGGTARWMQNPRGIARIFVPPVSPRRPLLEISDFPLAPEVACIVSELITPPLPEFALPPRPRRRVVRALAVLVQPFRSIGALLSRSEPNLSSSE